MVSKTITVVLWLFPLCAMAGDNWDYSDSHKDKCSSGGMNEMNSCLESAADEVRSRMFSLYEELLGNLDNPERLKEAQSAWVDFRNKTCEFAVSGISREGSLRPYSERACIIDLMEKRIRDFESYLEWGGCDGCPPYKTP